MALTNNTKYRKKTITINKKVNGSLVTTGGFPVVVSILSAFGAFPAIDAATFRTMTDADYGTRLNAFYDYLEATYTFWTRASVSNTASGTDAVICPLDNTAAPTINVVSFGAAMTSVNASAYDDHLEWNITIDQVASQDIPYYFDVNLTDKNTNLFRTERVHGTILAGQSTHSSGSLSYYIPEAADSLYAPVTATAIPGTVDLNI